MPTDTITTPEGMRNPMPTVPDEVREAMRAEFRRHHMISHNGHDICDFTLRVLCALPADSRLALSRALLRDHPTHGVFERPEVALASDGFTPEQIADMEREHRSKHD